MSLSIHSVSILLSSSSACAIGWTGSFSRCSICTFMLLKSLLAHSPVLKCVCSELQWFRSLSACRCFLNLFLIDWQGWPTYWYLHCLHWMRYTTLVGSAVSDVRVFADSASDLICIDQSAM